MWESVWTMKETQAWKLNMALCSSVVHLLSALTSLSPSACYHCTLDLLDEKYLWWNEAEVWNYLLCPHECHWISGLYSLPAASLFCRDCFFRYLPVWGLWTSEFNQSGRMFFTSECQNSSGVEVRTVEVRLREIRGYPMRMQTQSGLIKRYLKET